MSTETGDAPKVSIITPVFNGEVYLRPMIQSVIDQSYDNWELIIVNDGSTDSTRAIVQEFLDHRLIYLEQEHMGVAAARNSGLAIMRGDYFCFLDADDFLPAHSIEVRLRLFLDNSELTFVDGKVTVMDENFQNVIRSWSPRFEGNPLNDLVSLSGLSFFGVTWMIRRSINQTYKFHDGLTHSEDLLFYMELARSACLYGYTNEIVLFYRKNPRSAMRDLIGLENGYRYVYDNIKNWAQIELRSLNRYRQVTKQIMFKSYLQQGMVRRACNVLLWWF